MMEEQAPEDGKEQEEEDDVATTAAGLVQAALRIAAPQVVLPGDVSEMPEHLSRVKLGAYRTCLGGWVGVHTHGLLTVPFPHYVARQWPGQRPDPTGRGPGHQGRHPPLPAPQHVPDRQQPTAGKSLRDMA